jgi:hypothetical protein
MDSQFERPKSHGLHPTQTVGNGEGYERWTHTDLFGVIQ